MGTLMDGQQTKGFWMLTLATPLRGTSHSLSLKKRFEALVHVYFLVDDQMKISLVIPLFRS
jgi:hypothetical protein